VSFEDRPGQLGLVLVLICAEDDSAQKQPRVSPSSGLGQSPGYGVPRSSRREITGDSGGFVGGLGEGFAPSDFDVFGFDPRSGFDGREVRFDSRGIGSSMYWFVVSNGLSGSDPPLG
jgi:hypothetical protein